MADHWKSTPRYWCKHCTSYIKDTPFERKQHENTSKHQSNLKRFLHTIQKDHAKSERDKENAKSEIDRLNRLAGSAPASSSSSAASPSVVSATSNKSKSSTSTLSAADQKRQWAQLADMGIAVPDHARAEMAIAGDWQTISPKQVDDHVNDYDEKLNVGIRKRKLEDDDEGQEALADIVVRKGWGSSTKAYPGNKADSEDLNTLLTTPLLVKKGKAGSLPTEHPTTSLPVPPPVRDPPIKQEPPNIVPLQSGPENLAPLTDSSLTPSSLSAPVKGEGEGAEPKSERDEPPVPMFKKRRAKISPATQLV